jgi:hypothetical protein
MEASEKLVRKLRHQLNLMFQLDRTALGQVFSGRAVLPMMTRTMNPRCGHHLEHLQISGTCELRTRRLDLPGNTPLGSQCRTCNLRLRFKHILPLSDARLSRAQGMRICCIEPMANGTLQTDKLLLSTRKRCRLTLVLGCSIMPVRSSTQTETRREEPRTLAVSRVWVGD